MKYALVILSVFTFIAAPSTAARAASYEKDKDFRCSPSVSDCPALTDALVTMVRSQGYRCDSVSYVDKWMLKVGFTIRCNNFRNEFAIEDHGGRWIIKVKD